MALTLLPSFVQPLLLSHALSGVDSKQHCNIPNEGVLNFYKEVGKFVSLEKLTFDSFLLVDHL